MRTRAFSILALVAFLATQSGCYAGRTREGKTVAYAVNTTMVFTGIGGVAHSSGQHDDAEIASTLSVIPILVGLIGIGINLATPTEPYGGPSPSPATTSAPGRSTHVISASNRATVCAYALCEVSGPRQ